MDIVIKTDFTTIPPVNLKGESAIVAGVASLGLMHVISPTIRELSSTSMKHAIGVPIAFAGASLLIGGIGYSVVSPDSFFSRLGRRVCSIVTGVDVHSPLETELARDYRQMSPLEQEQYQKAKAMLADVAPKDLSGVYKNLCLQYHPDKLDTLNREILLSKAGLTEQNSKNFSDDKLKQIISCKWRMINRIYEENTRL